MRPSNCRSSSASCSFSRDHSVISINSSTERGLLSISSSFPPGVFFAGSIGSKFLVHLGLIEGVGPVTVSRICSHATITGFVPENYYAFSSHDWVTHCGVSPRVAQLIHAGLRDHTDLEKEYQQLATSGCHVVTLCDASYPQLLRAIAYPPVVLYVRGVLSDNHEQALAVVGARRADRYANDVIEQVVPSLVRAGWVIISGGARGVDSMAHREVIRTRGVTWAVLGSGLLKLYPREHTALFDEIVAAGGALISPFPLNHPPLPGNFPARNRIISGLSRGCLVVQAQQKSGALITAQCALDQGREVFAVPGPIMSSLSDGCHDLIKEGAILVRTADDITQEFGADAIRLERLDANQSSDMVDQLRLSLQKTPQAGNWRRCLRALVRWKN